MSKRPREEGDAPTTTAYTARRLLPDYNDTTRIPTQYNTELHMLISQLKAAFVEELAVMEDTLGDIIRHGTTSTCSMRGGNGRSGDGKAISGLLGGGGGPSDVAVAADGSIIATGIGNGANDGCDLAVTGAASSLLLQQQQQGAALAAVPAAVSYGGATATVPASNTASSPSKLETILVKLQQGFRSRAKAMCLVDMVTRLQQERVEMLRMRDHMVTVLDEAEDILVEEEEMLAAAQGEGDEVANNEEGGEDETFASFD